MIVLILGMGFWPINFLPINFLLHQMVFVGWLYVFRLCGWNYSGLGSRFCL